MARRKKNSVQTEESPAKAEPRITREIRVAILERIYEIQRDMIIDLKKELTDLKARLPGKIKVDITIGDNK